MKFSRVLAQQRRGEASGARRAPRAPTRTGAAAPAPRAPAPRAARARPARRPAPRPAPAGTRSAPPALAAAPTRPVPHDPYRCRTRLTI